MVVGFRGDTTMIVSVCAGILVGSWCNYQLGNMAASGSSPPYRIIWPSVEMLGCTILRTVLGLCGVLATRAVAKFASYALLCAALGLPQGGRDHATRHVAAELCYKYFTYGLIGFNTTYVFPNVFHLLRINRPTYYTEI